MNISVRSGNFTSSQMHKLAVDPKTGNKPFLKAGETYIEERWLERVLHDKLSDDSYARGKAWGKFCEAYLFTHKLGTEYEISSQESVRHYDDYLGRFWAGTRDFNVNGIEGGCVAETKSYYKKGFALYSLALIKGDIDFLKQNHAEEYWQIVSNSILYRCKYGEGLCFMPSVNDLSEMKELAGDATYIEKNNLGEPWHYRFIAEEKPENLQLLNPNSMIPSINSFRFEVPQEDKDHLTEKVEIAIERLEDLID